MTTPPTPFTFGLDLTTDAGRAHLRGLAQDLSHRPFLVGPVRQFSHFRPTCQTIFTEATEDGVILGSLCIFSAQRVFPCGLHSDVLDFAARFLNLDRLHVTFPEEARAYLGNPVIVTPTHPAYIDLEPTLEHGPGPNVEPTWPASYANRHATPEDHLRATAFDLAISPISYQAGPGRSYSPWWQPRANGSGPLSGRVHVLPELEICGWLGAVRGARPRLALSLRLPGEEPARFLVPPRAEVPVYLPA